jgi:predicted nucleic acid-binding protein
MRFVFDTSVLIEYLRGNDLAADALFLAPQIGQTFVTSISLMELHLPEDKNQQIKSNQQIKQEIKALTKLFQQLNINIIPCSDCSQKLALRILENHRSSLGRNALTDSLIIGIGIARRAYLITRDAKWFTIAEQSSIRIKVLSPEKLVEEF